MLDPTPGIEVCQSCPLSLTRTQVVPGEGVVDRPRILFVGEAPGETEDESGRPFVGKAGVLLRSIAETVGIGLDQCRITNAVHCRPVDEGSNRTPQVKEIDACRPWLVQEIQAVRPQFIAALGDTAMRSLFGLKRPKITEARRLSDLAIHYESWAEAILMDDPDPMAILVGVPVIACFHPSYALRSPGNMGDFVRDMERLSIISGFKEQSEDNRNYTEIPIAVALELVQNFVGKDVALDTEFEDGGELVCFSFTDEPGKAYVVVLPEHDQPDDRALDPYLVCLNTLIILANRVWYHNAKADMAILQEYGVIQPDKNLHDTIHLCYLLGYKPLALKSLAETRLGRKVVRLDEIRAKGQPLREVPRKELIDYSGQDVDLTLSLAMKEWGELHRL